MHLDEIVDWIDRAFGEELVFSNRAVGAEDLAVLQEILGDDDYQRHLRDQINRQIIRDYLTNAVVLGILSEGALAAFAAQVASEEGRSTLALYMLMTAVEDARDLPPVNGEVEVLTPLQPEPDDRSHIKLVPN